MNKNPTHLIVVLKARGKKATATVVPNDLHALQKLVGGPVVTMPYDEQQNLMYVCSEGTGLGGNVLVCSIGKDGEVASAPAAKIEQIVSRLNAGAL
jgi:hypothetical protein